MTQAFRTLLLLFTVVIAAGADWPQWGGSAARNNAPESKSLPNEWNLGQFVAESGRWLADSAKNVRWVARLGKPSYGTPVVAGGRVFCGTNNGGGRLERYPAKIDLGCLLCFRQNDGRFEWQLSCEKLGNSVLDFPQQGICCSPLVEGDRLWIVTNRCEVVCLETAARPGLQSPSVVWTFNMTSELGVRPNSMTASSITAVGDLLLLNTSNGADQAKKRVPAAKAPSFIALNKQTGKLVWSDNSPGNNILDGQWSSPAAAVLGGVPQAIFAGGDGWIYSFRIPSGDGGKSELLWKFDANAKKAVWKTDGSGDRNNVIATPVVVDGRVYIATGAEPDYGQGPGCLWCIDPTKRGDVSPELVVDKNGQPIADAVRASRRICAIDESAGESTKQNPNSAALWRYAGIDANGDGKLDFEETMHRSISTAVVKDGLLVIADLAGVVHCLDAKTGKAHWTHDLMAQVWGSACVADGKIYIGTQDGDVAVFKLSAKPELLATNAMGSAVYCTPVVVDDVLYIAASTHLIAVGYPADKSH